MAVPNEHTFPHLATLGDCSIKTALRWLKTKHWIGKYIGMHPGMSLALATFTNHSPKLPYLSNCITLVKIFFWKHRVNFVHYVLLPTEQAETYLKIYYLTHILRRVVKKKQRIFYDQAECKRLLSPPLRSAFCDFFGVLLTLYYDCMCSEMDFTPEKSNYKNSQLLLTAAAALSQNGQIAV